MDIALLIARLIIGFAMTAHAAQKLFGWFGGDGLSHTGNLFEHLGFRPGRLFVLIAALAEGVGGLLIAIGLGGALGPAFILLVMLVAMFTVHFSNGFFAERGGWEINALYIAGVLALAFGGFGPVSLDNAFGLSFLTNGDSVVLAVVVAILLAAINIGATDLAQGVRQRAKRKQTESR